MEKTTQSNHVLILISFHRQFDWSNGHYCAFRRVGAIIRTVWSTFFSWIVVERSSLDSPGRWTKTGSLCPILNRIISEHLARSDRPVDGEASGEMVAVNVVLLVAVFLSPVPIPCLAFADLASESFDLIVDCLCGI